MRLQVTALSSTKVYISNSTKAILNITWPTLVNSYSRPSDAKLYGESLHATTNLALHYYHSARVPEMTVPPPQRSTL
jgi:hypothetical protein